MFLLVGQLPGVRLLKIGLMQCVSTYNINGKTISYRIIICWENLIAMKKTRKQRTAYAVLL
jgi:hypothetical protein